MDTVRRMVLIPAWSLAVLDLLRDQEPAEDVFALLGKNGMGSVYMAAFHPRMVFSAEFPALHNPLNPDETFEVLGKIPRAGGNALNRFDSPERCALLQFSTDWMDVSTDAEGHLYRVQVGRMSAHRKARQMTFLQNSRESRLAGVTVEFRSEPVGRALDVIAKAGATVVRMLPRQWGGSFAIDIFASNGRGTNIQAVINTMRV